MKKLNFLVCLSYLFTFSLFAADVLTIEVTNIKKVKGKLNLAMYNSEKSFGSTADVSKTFKNTQVDVNANKMVFTFKDFPKGKYAVNV